MSIIYHTFFDRNKVAKSIHNNETRLRHRHRQHCLRIASDEFNNHTIGQTTETLWGLQTSLRSCLWPIRNEQGKTPVWWAEQQTNLEFRFTDMGATVWTVVTGPKPVTSAVLSQLMRLTSYVTNGANAIVVRRVITMTLVHRSQPSTSSKF